MSRVKAEVSLGLSSVTLRVRITQQVCLRLTTLAGIPKDLRALWVSFCCCRSHRRRGPARLVVAAGGPAALLKTVQSEETNKQWPACGWFHWPRDSARSKRTLRGVHCGCVQGNITLWLSLSLGWHAVTLICTNWPSLNIITNLWSNITKQRPSQTCTLFILMFLSVSTHYGLSALVSLLNIPHASWALELKHLGYIIGSINRKHCSGTLTQTLARIRLLCWMCHLQICYFEMRESVLSGTATLTPAWSRSRVRSSSLFCERSDCAYSSCDETFCCNTKWTQSVTD